VFSRIWSREVQVGLFRSLQPPEDETGIPAAVRRARATASVRALQLFVRKINVLAKFDNFEAFWYDQFLFLPGVSNTHCDEKQSDDSVLRHFKC
jgi:hypothetical protein